MFEDTYILYKTIFKSIPLSKYRPKGKKKKVACVIEMKNNIQNACIANIIKHVFVVQVKSTGDSTYTGQLEGST